MGSAQVLKNPTEALARARLAIDTESAVSPADVLLRRTPTGFLSPGAVPGLYDSLEPLFMEQGIPPQILERHKQALHQWLRRNIEPIDLYLGRTSG